MYFTFAIGIESALELLAQHAKQPKKILKTAITMEIMNAAEPKPTPYFQLSLPVKTRNTLKFFIALCERTFKTVIQVLLYFIAPTFC